MSTTDIIRHLDPATGDIAFDDVAGTWVNGGSAAMESGAFIVGTPLGSCPLATTEGVDYAAVPKVTAQSGPALRRALLDGFKPAVNDGTMASPSALVGSPSGRALTYTVTFTDPSAAPGAPVPTLTGTV